MDSIYVFKYVPSSVKRLIYLYLIGLGTPTSKLIKEEYDKLFGANKHNIIVYKHMSMYEDKDIGFMGLREVMKLSVKNFFQRAAVSFDFYKQYTGDIGTKLKEDLLLPQQLYEIDCAKMFYVYNCSNAVKYNIILSILADRAALVKLFKYKVLQLNSEEESEI